MNKRLFNLYDWYDLELKEFQTIYGNYILYDDGLLVIEKHPNIVSAVESRLNLLEDYVAGKPVLGLSKPEYEMLKEMSVEERKLWYILKSEVE